MGIESIGAGGPRVNKRAKIERASAVSGPGSPPPAPGPAAPRSVVLLGGRTGLSGPGLRGGLAGPAPRPGGRGGTSVRQGAIATPRRREVPDSTSSKEALDSGGGVDAIEDSQPYDQVHVYKNDIRQAETFKPLEGAEERWNPALDGEEVKEETQARWAQRWHASGMGEPEFSQRYGIPVPTLHAFNLKHLTLAQLEGRADLTDTERSEEELTETWNGSLESRIQFTKLWGFANLGEFNKVLSTYLSSDEIESHLTGQQLGEIEAVSKWYTGDENLNEAAPRLGMSTPHLTYLANKYLSSEEIAAHLTKEEKRQRALAEEWLPTDQSIAIFADSKGVPESNMYYWIHKYLTPEQIAGHVTNRRMNPSDPGRPLRLAKEFAQSTDYIKDFADNNDVPRSTMSYWIRTLLEPWEIAAQIARRKAAHKKSAERVPSTSPPASESPGSDSTSKSASARTKKPRSKASANPSSNEVWEKAVKDWKFKKFGSTDTP